MNNKLLVALMLSISASTYAMGDTQGHPHTPTALALEQSVRQGDAEQEVDDTAIEQAAFRASNDFSALAQGRLFVAGCMLPVVWATALYVMRSQNP